MKRLSFVLLFLLSGCDELPTTEVAFHGEEVDAGGPLPPTEETPPGWVPGWLCGNTQLGCEVAPPIWGGP